MNGIKREVMGLPLYAWLAGGAALLLSILYFARHKGSGTTTAIPAGASTGSYPQNIYDSTNIYGHTGSVPGSTSAAPSPVPSLQALGGWSFGKPLTSQYWWRWDPAFAAKYGLSGDAQYGQVGPAPAGADGTYSWQFWLPSSDGTPTPIQASQSSPKGIHFPPLPRNISPANGMGGGAAALMPSPVNPVAWAPRMNSDIFGTSGPSPIAPIPVWGLSPPPGYQ
jgi:hypothetical protein